MNKQIEEMARTICGEKEHGCAECDGGDLCEFFVEASILYSAGYRKASEIFEEIDRKLSVDENGFNAIAEEGLSEGHAYCETYVHNLRAHLAELKKKYESEGADDEN